MAWLWIGLALASVGYFAWLGWWLFGKGKALVSQVMPLLGELQQAQQSLNKSAEYQPKRDAISAGLEASLAERAALQRTRAKAKEQRRRRLIERLR